MFFHRGTVNLLHMERVFSLGIKERRIAGFPGHGGTLGLFSRREESCARLECVLLTSGRYVDIYVRQVSIQILICVEQKFEAKEAKMWGA